MAIKVQYVASDNKAFDSIEEAKEYEKNLKRAKKSTQYYHVKLVIECDCRIEARDEKEAGEIAQDKWFTGNLKCEEDIYDIQVYEE